MSDLAQKITVVIRKRPLGKRELARKEDDIVDVSGLATVVVKEIKQKVDLTKFVEEHNFNFDLAFGHESTNEQVYMSAVRPIIEAAFNRARVTCFAYGQTGSGKTHTMLGDADRQIPGMYILAAYDIFQMLQQQDYSHLSVCVSFFEIYCGKLFDLLNSKTPIQVREDAKANVNLINLSEKKVTSVQQLMQIISQGQACRVTSQNSANAESSRSHAILQINIKTGKSVYGKLSFIDLAGSERGADVSDQNKQTRIDGAEINKSLLALKECIRALDLNKNHTPFRGSKLTLVLKDSLTGNCRTVMIGNISPSSASSEHTLNTLRYADRVKELKKPQDKMNQGDYMQRELMLARNNNNVVRKAYKAPDEDDDEDSCSSYSYSNQCSVSQVYQPTVNNNYNTNNNNYANNHTNNNSNHNNNYNLNKQNHSNNSYGMEQNGSSMNRFNLSSLPTISGGSMPVLPQNHSQQNLQQNNQQNINHQKSHSHLNQFNNQPQLFSQNYQQQPQLFNQQLNQQQQQYIQQQNNNINKGQYYINNYQYNDTSALSQSQSSISSFQNQDQMIEEDLGYNSNSCTDRNQSQLSRYSTEIHPKQNSQKPLQEIHQNHEFKAHEQQLMQQNMLNEHKALIDKIVEITKEEMGIITQLQNTNNVNQYMTKVIGQLQHKIEYITNFQNKLKQAQKEIEFNQYPQQQYTPNQHIMNYFQQDDMLLNADESIL